MPVFHAQKESTAAQQPRPIQQVTVLLATYVKDLLLTLHQPKVFHGVDCVRQDTTAPQGQRMKDLVRKELTYQHLVEKLKVTVISAMKEGTAQAQTIQARPVIVLQVIIAREVIG